MKARLPHCAAPSKARIFPSDGSRRARLLLLFIALLPLGLSGCAAKRLRVDFTGFEKSYAESSNREVLLNLARLENRDPTYFFKIGQITSTYKMAASLGGSGSYAVSSSNPNIGAPAGGGTTGLTYENDPIFTFIPVNDETNAQLLLKPVPQETFYILYQQGWRADQLVRLMVDRIELTRVSAQGCTVETIRNAPPAVHLKADGSWDADYSRDPDTLSSYVTFLRINAVVYWLQKHGHLLLRGSSAFVPYESNSGLDDSAASAPKAQDVVSASQKNAVWEHVGSKWLLGEKVFTPVFSLYPLQSVDAKPSPDIKQIKREILADPEMKELKQGAVLDEILASLANGFSIESSSEHQDSCNSTAPGAHIMSAHLVMRSLIGLMAAAAQEQTPYDVLARTNPTIPNSRYLPPELQLKPLPRFMEAVPAIERIPLLSLTGKAEDELPPIIEVNYRGTDYRIADKKIAEVAENQYWNRDMFRLIDQLTSQVTVDISKFPLTEILQ
jgi:hypothetical protein